MTTAAGDYSDWRSIDYQPASYFLPDDLLSFVAQGQSVLDIGCGSCESTIFLARRGLRLLGVDINPRAIAAAAQTARANDLNSVVQFQVADILHERDLGSFDVVLMIRMLTCLPSPDDWQLALERAYASLVDGGIVYVHDFCYSPRNAEYHERYDEATRLNWRPGNFAVRDTFGKIMFVAHHHTQDELRRIMAPYETLRLRIHEGLSMHGNPVEMLEFLGRKPTEKRLLPDADLNAVD